MNNTKRGRFSVVSYGRNTNSSIIDDYNERISEYSNEYNDNDNDVSIVSTANNDNNDNTISIRFKCRNKARKLTGSTTDSLDEHRTEGNILLKSFNITYIAANNMTTD